MTRHLLSASTLPVEPAAGPLLLFIQQAQLSLLYGEGHSKSAVKSDGTLVLRSDEAAS